jgi:signal peptidase I
MNEQRSFLSKIVYGGGVIFDLGKWMIFGLIILSIINTFFVAIFVVDGISMEPNLHDKEFVLWQKKAVAKDLFVRGNVVVVNYPGDLKKKYVKRIVGMPGDRIDVYDGKVYINKKLHKEEYLPLGLSSVPDGTWNLKSDQYFVMGDNRPNSNDSRYFGPVESRFILGKAIAIVLPRFMMVRDI